MHSRQSEPADRNIAGWVVLLVDDTPDNQMVAMIALKHHGAVVHTASNGEEALAVLQTIRPTVILADIKMPKMNGWEMFKALRENPETAHIPVIAVTAYAMDADREQILSAGFDGYIAKPFNLFTLVADVKRLVTEHEMARQKSEQVRK